MRYVSTRHGARPTSFAEALEMGMAPDGGLFEPQELPAIGARLPASGGELPALAEAVLAPFLAGDRLAPVLGDICRAAFTFPVPLVDLAGASILELFHGPTAAFKDIGARFLAECLTRLPRPPRLILVATSGDTGGAVAAAFWQRPGVEVGILFPRDGVAERQRRQLTGWGENVRALAVRGSFDECQSLLRRALALAAWRERGTTTANSINIGRLLPQVVCYAAAALAYHARHGVAPGFIVPTGNAGNATAALWAKRMGFPVREVVMALNANQTIAEFLATGEWRPRRSVATLANAMDVGDPSNMERVRRLYGSIEDLRRDVRAVVVPDAAIAATLAGAARRWGRVFDPHTATAVHALERLGDGPWIVVATAHPAKFASVVEPLVGAPVPVPDSLASQLARRSECREIDPDLDALAAALA